MAPRTTAKKISRPRKVIGGGTAGRTSTQRRSAATARAAYGSGSRALSNRIVRLEQELAQTMQDASESKVMLGELIACWNQQFPQNATAHIYGDKLPQQQRRAA